MNRQKVSISQSLPIICIYFCVIFTTMSGDYKKLLNKKKKKYCDTKTMGVNIDKNEYYEIILSNSAHPENIKK